MLPAIDKTNFVAACVPRPFVYPSGGFRSFFVGLSRGLSGARSFATSVFRPFFFFLSIFIMRLPLTLNIQCGKKLSGKSKEDILKEVLKVFQHYHVKCVQVAYEVIRVTLASADEYKVPKQQPGIRLFGMWCPILGGGPPITILHIFDYPYEEDDVYVKNVIGDFGSVKRVKKQTYLSNPDVFTGTRLVSVTLDATPPRFITSNGYLCRIW